MRKNKHYFDKSTFNPSSLQPYDSIKSDVGYEYVNLSGKMVDLENKKFIDDLFNSY